MAVPSVMATQGIVGRGYPVQAANMNNYVGPGSWVHAVPGSYILQHPMAAVSLTLNFPLLRTLVDKNKLFFMSQDLHDYWSV